MTHPVPPSLHHDPPPRPELVTYVFWIYNSSHVPSGLHVASPSTTNRPSHLFRQSALVYVLAFEARSSFILFSTSSAFKPGAKTLTHPVPPSLHHAPPPRPELVTYVFRIHTSSHVPSGLHVASPSTTNRPSHLFRQSALEYILAFEARSSFILFSTPSTQRSCAYRSLSI